MATMDRHHHHQAPAQNYQQQYHGAADRAHIPPLPVWVIVVRALQFVTSVIVLAMCAWGVQEITQLIAFSTVPESEAYAFAFFVFSWTFIYLLYLLLAFVAFPAIYNIWAHLALECVTVLFWLVGFALLARNSSDYSTYQQDYINRDPRIRSLYMGTYASAGVSAGTLVLFIATLIPLAICVHHHLHPKQASGSVPALGGGWTAQPMQTAHDGYIAGPNDPHGQQQQQQLPPQQHPVVPSQQRYSPPPQGQPQQPLSGFYAPSDPSLYGSYQQQQQPQSQQSQPQQSQQQDRGPAPISPQHTARSGPIPVPAQMPPTSPSPALPSHSTQQQQWENDGAKVTMPSPMPSPSPGPVGSAAEHEPATAAANWQAYHSHPSYPNAYELSTVRGDSAVVELAGRQ